MSEFDRLLYARGFLLTDRPARATPAGWARLGLGRWTFLHDPAAPVHASDRTILFGFAVDLSSGSADGAAVVERIDALDDDALQDHLDQLAGRYVVVRLGGAGDGVLLQQDATGMRSVYYSEAMHPFVAGSHLDLVSRELDAPVNAFGASYFRDNGVQAYPGNRTQRLGIARLLPNSELDSTTRAARRVYPRGPLEPATVEEAARFVIDAADVQLAALGERRLTASLTAGLDSRVSLALLRGALPRTRFFTYDLVDGVKNEGNRHDREGALRLAEAFGLEHELFEPARPVDEGFRAVMARNTSFSHSLPIAKTYLDRLSDGVLHVRSNAFEIGRAYYRARGIAPERTTAASMRHILSAGRSSDPLALDAFEEYRISSGFDAAVEQGYDGLDLFYWEHRMGAWMAPVLHESDIAHDTHVLVNARVVLDRMLGVPLDRRLDASVFRRVIALRWPALASHPVNGRPLVLDPAEAVEAGSAAREPDPPLPAPVLGAGPASVRRINPALAVHLHASVDAFAAAERVPSGVHVVNDGGRKIDVLVQDRGAPVTVVFFHGAVAAESVKPVFVGSGLSARRTFNRVSLSDPTLVVAPELTLSWFAGSREQPRLQESLRTIVDRVVRSLGTPPERVILFGTSGGGFAALQMGRRLPGSCTMAFNPQTSIARYEEKPVAKYLTRAWAVSSCAELPDSVEHELAPGYARGFGNTVLYVQNENDWFHIASHRRPFLDAVAGAGSAWSLAEKWNDPEEMMGHTIPPKEVVGDLLEIMVGSAGDWDAGAKAAGFRRA